MKCEKCNHEAVKIKKNHFCPNCGKKVSNDMGMAKMSQTTNNFIQPLSLPKKENSLEKIEPNVLNLRDNKKIDTLPSSPATLQEKAKENLPTLVSQVDVPEHIKSIIEKHTEPKNRAVIENNNQELPKPTIDNNLQKNIDAPIPTVKVESQVKSPENVFDKKKEEKFWDKPLEKNNMVPSKKEKTLKLMLTLVIGLNVLVILGIVYLLLT